MDQVTTTNHKAAEFLRRVRGEMGHLNFRDAWSKQNYLLHESGSSTAPMDRAGEVLEKKSGLAIFNLARQRTHAGVLALVDSAIKELEGAESSS